MDARPDTAPADSSAGDGAMTASDAAGDTAAPDAGMEVGASCTDNARNGNETDTDCGGSCGRCGVGKACLVNADCASGACSESHVCLECATAANCPGQDTECSVRACVNGACSVALVASGTVLTTQVAGDCRSRRCDGQGQVAQVNDDTDLPERRQPLHARRVHQRRAVESAGRVVELVRGQPDLRWARPLRRLLDRRRLPRHRQRVPHARLQSERLRLHLSRGGHAHGVAGHRRLQGQHLRRRGQRRAGEPGHRRAQRRQSLHTRASARRARRRSRRWRSGASCGGANICDGAGHCVQCVTAANCPGQDTDCQMRTCDTHGVCGLLEGGGGAATATQTTGDCRMRQCNSDRQRRALPSTTPTCRSTARPAPTTSASPASR